MVKNVNFDKLIIDSIDTVTAFSRTDGSILLMLDQLRDGTISNGAEVVYGTGRHGVRLSALDRNKTSTFSCTNGYVVASALAAQIGAKVELATEDAAFAVPHVEYITVSGDATSVTLEYDVVGETGAEIPFIYKSNHDKTQGEKFAIAAEASATEFSFAAASKTITLPTGVFSAGDVVIVPYDRKATVGKKLANIADQGSMSARIVLDITCCDVCDNNIKYHTVFEYPNAKIDGNFEMAFGDEPMVHNFGAEAMTDPCATTNTLWSYYIA